MARPRTIRSEIRGMRNFSFLYVFVIISLLGLLLSVNTANAQQTTTESDLNAELDSSLEEQDSSATVSDGQPLCSCSPSTYTFTLDFSLTCPPVNVTRNGGIAATFCQISPFGDAESNITDLVPVEVGYVDVLELGQAFEVLTQVNITGTFVDGDTIPYTSIASSSGSSSDDEIPKVIQLNIFAFNAAGQPIVNFYAIAFSNNCDEYPTLLEGESAGWTQFTKLDPPVEGSCPAASLNTNPPTPAGGGDDPTIAPIAVDPVVPDTNEPTVAPVDPTDEPTVSFNDTMAPTTMEPSPAPVVADTAEPSSAPVVADTAEPTSAPVVADTDAPTEAPVISDTGAPTESFNDTMAPTTMEPSPSPVVADTDEPTAAPVVAADTDAPTPIPTVFILPTTDSPIAEDTDAPTPEITMSMYMSMSMDMMDSEFLGLDEMMMSMSMSMSMPSRGFLRKSDSTSKKGDKSSKGLKSDSTSKKGDKSSKGLKSDSSSKKGDKSSKGLKSTETKSSKKGDKEEKKSSKVTKIEKGDKESNVEEFFRKDTEPEPKEVTSKAGKDEKGRRRRRLRVHRVD